ncbi:RloB family protein [Vibrio sp.]|uniref:RloB family protein n=1 Tax=Vibrio sp. TaxID=678 RepID=UPI003F6D9B98
MSARQSSRVRGSKYKQSQTKKAITIHIAYEGAVDEAEYFEQLPSQIFKRYRGLFKIIPIEKSSTDAAPQKVRDDIFAYLDEKKIRGLKNKNSSDIVFMVIDRDDHFNNTHAQENIAAINECVDKGVIVLCTVPCFELWLILHYLDVSKETDDFKTKLLENRKTKGSTFSKRTMRRLRGGEEFSSMQAKTQVALDNEKALNLLSKNSKSLVPSDLNSRVGVIFKYIEDLGVELKFKSK